MRIGKGPLTESRALGFAIVDLEPTDNRSYSLGTYRFTSAQFTFTAPTPWIFGADGGTGTAVSSGYFLLIKPLAPGEHELECGGAFHFSTAEGDPFDADFAFGNIYQLTVK